MLSTDILNNTLLSSDILKNFRDNFLREWKLVPANSHSEARPLWTATLKIIKGPLELSTKN